MRLILAAVMLCSSWVQAAPAINFQLTDSNNKIHHLSDYRGKWVLVNFWAPWCPRCKMEVPVLNDLDAITNFAVISVAMDYGVDKNSVINTKTRYNMRFPVIIGTGRRDENSPANQVGPVDFYPTSYLYNPNGEVVMYIPGIISKQRIITFINK